MFLTDGEIIQTTRKHHKRAQMAALNMMGIQYKVRPDGSLLVLRAHVEQVLGIKVQGSRPIEAEPHWEALDRAKAA